MTYTRLLIGLIITWYSALAGQAQNPGTTAPESEEFGLTSRQAEALRNRWNSSQPVVALNVAGKQPVTGQPVYFGRDSVMIYPKTRLPVGGEWQNDLVAVPLYEVTSMALQPGGNWIRRSGSSRFYALKPAGTETTAKAIRKLHNATVYRDSLVPAQELTDAFSHSRVLRQVFPNKHFRISLGVGLGGDVVADEVTAALRSSPLGEPEYGYGQTADFEWADLAIRLFGRVMVGWRYSSFPDYANWYYYSSGKENYFNYSYRIELYEHRIYGEYGLFHVDRYFSRPFEWTVGAGMILARPEKSFDYYYEDYSDPDQINSAYLNDQMTFSITGLHLKSVFHYFFIPGLSLYAGLEASLYEKWIIPEQTLPGTDNGGEMILPEYGITLNSIRFRAGVSIYL